jgi:hypothetical protein
MQVAVIGLDIAKHVFQIHGVDVSGRAVLPKRLRTGQIPGFFGSVSRGQTNRKKSNGRALRLTRSCKESHPKPLDRKWSGHR